MNSICLIGNICNDLEIKTTQNGVEFLDFTVAVRRQYKKDETDFIRCRAWQKTAAFVTGYFSKGKQIALTGQLRVDSYVDKNGENKSFTYVNAESVYFCGGNSQKKTAAAATAYTATDDINIDDIADDDIPF